MIIESNYVSDFTNTHGNEGITVAGRASNVRVRFNTVGPGQETDGTGDEGIDFKEGVVNSSIYGNTVIGTGDVGILIDGGDGKGKEPITQNIRVYNNYLRDVRRSGIVISTEGAGDVDNVQVYNNIVEKAAKDGILVFAHNDSEVGATVTNVKVVHNTVLESGYYGGGFWGGIGVVEQPNADGEVDGVIIRQNIAVGNTAYDIKVRSGPENVVWTTSTGIAPNLCRDTDYCDYNHDSNSNEPLLKLTTSSGDTGDEPDIYAGQSLSSRFTPADCSPAVDNAFAEGSYTDHDFWTAHRNQTRSLRDLGAVENQENQNDCGS